MQFYFKKSSKLIDLSQRLFWVFFLSKISIFCFLFFKTDGVDRSRVADRNQIRGLFGVRENFGDFRHSTRSAWQKSSPLILSMCINVGLFV
jgi:hypothetical protein